MALHKRTGEAMRGAVLTSGLVSALLLPWVMAWVRAAADRYGVMLGDDYAYQLTAALASAIAYAGAYIKQRAIASANEE